MLEKLDQEVELPFLLSMFFTISLNSNNLIGKPQSVAWSFLLAVHPIQLRFPVDDL